MLKRLADKILLKSMLASVAMACVAMACVAFPLFWQETARADFFWNDSKTRFVMSAADRRMAVVQVMRDTGVLLTDSIVLTARHAVSKHDGYSAHGSSLFYSATTRDKSYFKIESILEEDEALDYALLKIAWLDGLPPSGLQTVRSLNHFGGYRANVVYTNDFFVLGVPWDRIPDPIRANGTKFALRPIDKFGKELIIFNAGVTSGNSGGPLFDSFGRLMGIVLGGNHALGDEASLNNDPDDPDAWNYGLSIHSIYRVSPLLRTLFP